MSLSDGEESIFNPNCRTDILLDDIKRRCNCTKDGTFFEKFSSIFHFQYYCLNSLKINIPLSVATVDLSDEAGNVKYLVNHPLRYATELLKARESFVLIRVESKFIFSENVVLMLCPPAVKLYSLR